MAEKPDKILIFCEGCKKESSLAAIYRNRGMCPACQHGSWHIQSIYLARQDTGDAASLTLKALGIGLVTSDGSSLPSPIPGEKRPVNGFDIHGVQAEEILELSNPAVNPQVKLTAYVLRKQDEHYKKHRQAMERNGQVCDQCGVLFVASEQKPWTLLGTCSKVCCAAKLGAADYALIEQRVLDLSQERLKDFKKTHRDQRGIWVTCSACDHQFELSRIYAGVQRKCPECGRKVQVPDY